MLFLMKLTPSHYYGYWCDCWWLRLNRDNEMQNTCVNSLIITLYCVLISLVKPDTVQPVQLCQMDLWLTEQSESIKSDMDILGATISTVDGSAADKIGWENIKWIS
jgi:hypothetical protein